jgi:hypothetical protein
MRRLIPFLVLVAGIVLVGCEDKPKTADNSGAKTTTAEVKKSGSKHDGWWCVEHGIPEHECIMCMKDGEETAKKKGDWCEIHEFPKSQCFGCDPKLKERYAAQFRAKYGKEPPEPDDNPPSKNPSK